MLEALIGLEAGLSKVEAWVQVLLYLIGSLGLLWMAVMIVMGLWLLIKWK